jgi:hypothetical protein
MHRPCGALFLGFDRPAIGFERRLAARLRRERYLHAAADGGTARRVVRQEHRLLDHQVVDAVPTIAKELLGSGQPLLDVSRGRCDGRALYLVIN